MKQKKEQKKQQKLSLNKLRMTKINNLRVITGGLGGNNLEDDNDNTITFPTDKGH